MPIFDRRVRAQQNDGPWSGWQQFWRNKTAEQNIDTRQFQAEDALQVGAIVGAVMVLAKMAASSEVVVERMTSAGDWETGR